MLTITQRTKIDYVEWQSPISLSAIIWYLRNYLAFRSSDPIDHLSFEADDLGPLIIPANTSYRLSSITGRLT